MTKTHSDLDFIRDMLLAALDERRDNIVGDLFKMYEQARIESRPTIPTGNINIDTLTKPDGTEYNFTLQSDYLGDVKIGNSLNNDVISFGDYTSTDKEFLVE
jgi:hypothetical protein